jgi:hypothetical protein
MQVKIIVQVDEKEVAAIEQTVETTQELELEEQTERLKDRFGTVVLECGFQEVAKTLSHPCCCGRRMENKGKRCVSVMSQSGEVVLERNRYRCRVCSDWRTPADATICCGKHRITRYLARQVCQLATVEHFTRLEQLVLDQHGVQLGHDPMLNLVHDVGAAAEAKRLADVQCWQRQSPDKRRWPEPEVTPQRVYVSCDGIMYCTNQTEPDPKNPGENRLTWKQMRVGCVYWQDAKEKWHKRVIWGQEEDFRSFGASLYRLACRCGYRQAEEKIFAADGGDWCWTIHQDYFADAAGILDWYHASEHVWTCAKVLNKEAPKAWADDALDRLWKGGGEGLLRWLLSEKTSPRGKKRAALDALIKYIQPRLDRTDYPTYRAQDWQIGTGMIESTAKQLVGIRLKGPGMHWSPHGATAITALRAYDLNTHWHPFWKNLTLAT